ncbi:S8 family serine peptidase [Roseomonas sp. OT10]|uniref:S8 family serine peptidase n=1 Tax=Roseomonas cutis TaxID=2897332 RepID=UPI001E3B66A5|nr:S8 family serine peptidase [Roseomonas sp. OT10]UFN49661.1 S8 family serine peptidase [Roseomonas sp. OT10]
MSEAEDPVELFDTGGPGDFAQLESWRDPESGRYFGCEAPDHLRPTLEMAYRQHAPAPDAARFEALWRQPWRLDECRYDPTAMAQVAVLDTGILTGHPLLASQIAETVDFTGEGIEDRVGHGTAVAMLLRLQKPGLPPPFLVVLKVVGANGQGSEENLLAAMDWLRHRPQPAEGPGLRVANMSLGIHRRRWGFLACDGSCRLCRAAVALSEEVMLCVAAGNTAGRTACPAQAGLLADQGKLPPNGIMAVGSSNQAGLGTGTVAAPSHAVVRRLPL